MILRYLLIIPLLMFWGCQSAEIGHRNAESRTMLTTIKTESGLSLPEDLELLFHTDDGRGAQQAELWMLHSKSAIEISSIFKNVNLENPAVQVPVEAPVQSLKQALPEKNLGAPAGDQAAVYNWSNAKGSWRLTSVLMTTGHYLTLEQFTGNK